VNWRDEWSALSQRIRGLSKTGSLLALLLQGRDHGGTKEISHQSKEIFVQLQEFKEGFTLPQTATAPLKRWLDTHRDLFLLPRPGENDQQVRARVAAMLPLLAALESEVTYHLADGQELVRRRSERAFVHLQRLIAADPEVRERWKKAFEKSEVRCGQLGAAHLLLHGIWAFKADAAGARTDLVFQEPLTSDSLSEVERAAEGLALTEWKVASSSEAKRKFKEARDQAALYAEEALAGFELTSYRYAVVVTKRRLSPPPDTNEGGITYRHINVAVDPATPSTDARRKNAHP
jgi:hypothetical protein